MRQPVKLVSKGHGILEGLSALLKWGGVMPAQVGGGAAVSESTARVGLMEKVTFDSLKQDTREHIRGGAVQAERTASAKADVGVDVGAVGLQ